MLYMWFPFKLNEQNLLRLLVAYINTIGKSLMVIIPHFLTSKTRLYVECRLAVISGEHIVTCTVLEDDAIAYNYSVRCFIIIPLCFSMHIHNLVSNFILTSKNIIQLLCLHDRRKVQIPLWKDTYYTKSSLKRLYISEISIQVQLYINEHIHWECISFFDVEVKNTKN